MTGHANFAEHGQDIVCAGASAVAFGALNAVDELNGQLTWKLTKVTDGFLTVRVPDDLNVRQQKKHSSF